MPMTLSNLITDRSYIPSPYLLAYVSTVNLAIDAGEIRGRFSTGPFSSVFFYNE